MIGPTLIASLLMQMMLGHSLVTRLILKLNWSLRQSCCDASCRLQSHLVYSLDIQARLLFFLSQIGRISHLEGDTECKD